MKVIVQNGYGSPGVFELKEVDMPVARDNEVLVRVHAVALGAGDYFIVRGVPYLVCLFAGWPRPRGYVPGYDVADRVEATGKNSTRFRPGDEVFGACKHGCTEYACGRERDLVPRPSNLTPEQAAAVPTSGMTALRDLRDAGKIRPGQKVLVNGASGCVGTFAVQIAKVFGAEVTGVCSTGKTDMVRAIGADHAIDYTREDFTQGERRYDLILDNVGNHSFWNLRRALGPQGIAVPNTGHAGLGYVVKAFALAFLSRRHGRPFVGVPKEGDWAFLMEMIESGRLTLVVDRAYPLSETPKAFRYLDAGHARGEVVITMGPKDRA